MVTANLLLSLVKLRVLVVGELEGDVEEFPLQLHFENVTVLDGLSPSATADEFRERLIAFEETGARQTPPYAVARLQ